jgi:hypothetical protein
MKTKKLNMRSSRMRSSQTTLPNSFGNNVSTLRDKEYDTYPAINPYFVCYSSKISNIRMDPIPWSNASYLVTQLGNGYILNYTDNNSNYYDYATFKAIPNSLQPTIDNIMFTYSDSIECNYYINNYNIGYPSTIASGSITVNQPILNSDFRFIVIVRYKDDQMPAGYFYVDVSKTGAVTLST